MESDDVARTGMARKLGASRDMTDEQVADWLAEIDEGRGPHGPDLIRLEVEVPLIEALRLLSEALTDMHGFGVSGAFADRYGKAGQRVARSEVEEPLAEVIFVLCGILSKIAEPVAPAPPVHRDRFLPVNRPPRPGPPPVVPKAPPRVHTQQERRQTQREQQAEEKRSGDAADSGTSDL